MTNVQRAALTAAFLLTLGALPMSRAKAGSSVLGATVCVRANLTSGAPSGLNYDVYGMKAELGAGGSAEIVCTLFRDNVTNTNGLVDLELTVFDPIGSTIHCNAVSLDRNGMVKKQIPLDSTSTPGNQILDWNGALNLSVARGYYAVRCQVSDQAYIRSLYYVEP